ncbi:MAG: cob(I)yrinic acid a,c-diamide adenosyltransferase [Pseudomonadota bacterium]
MNTEDNPKTQKHNASMKRKKAVIDKQIAEAQDKRGVFLFITGNGKGKTTSAFGTVVRALGHGQRVGVVQFIKGTQATGEVIYLQQHHPQLDYYAMATGFTWNTQDWDQDQAAAEQAWSHSKRMLADESLHLVLLDELTYMLKYGYLEMDQVVRAIESRPEPQNVIVTGRGAKPELVAIADTVSDIAATKHAFKAGVKAQAGVDY